MPVTAIGAAREAARDVVLSVIGDASPSPPPPFPPPAPLIAPVNATQPDSLIFFIGVLCCAIPFGIVIRILEDGDFSLSYDRFPAWLFAAYIIMLCAYGVLASQSDASPLDKVHWAIVTPAYLCALRHAFKVSESPKRYASAVTITFLVGFSVIFALKTSLRPKRCEGTIFVLVIFCGMPALRLRSKHGEDAEPETVGARKRCNYALMLVLLSFALQPWLGTCGAAAQWAETAQMALDLAVVVTVTDSLWSRGGLC